MGATIDDESFGNVVRRLRADCGLTQELLAERAGVSTRTISDVERGLRMTVYGFTANRLADALGLVPPDRVAFIGRATRRVAQPRARAAARLAASRAGIPKPLTGLIGRDTEVEGILTLIRAGNVRIVTLLGPGGVGKTRLALEIARLADDFPDGRFFVSLAATSDPSLVPSLIAAEIGVAGIRGSIAAALATHLRAKRTLLVLDTFEHVLAAAPLVAELAAACDQLTILATSRAPLRVRGEHEVVVPPLDVPEASPGIAELTANAAATLFVERARAVRPSFVVDGDSAPTIAQICRRLDGVPLALELAAARLRHFPLDGLERHLDDRLGLLVGGPRDLPARQQAMRDTIGWSYELLDAATRTLLCRLSVFSGGWTETTATSVCFGDAEQAAARALPGLSLLVDNSLVRMHGAGPGEGRFDMLDVVREFAADRLAADGQRDEFSRRHADCFLALAESAEGQLLRAAQQSWFVQLQSERGNIRTALRWALDHGQASVAQRLAAALWLFWRRNGDYAEGRLWLDRALTIDGDDDWARRKALWGGAWMSYYQGDHAAAGRYGDELLRLARDADNPLAIRNGLTIQGIVAMARGRFADSIAALEEALRIGRLAGDDWLLATSALNLGMATMHGPDLVRSRSLLEEALRGYRALGDEVFIARTLGYLGYVALLTGRRQSARRLFASSLRRFHDLDETFGTAEALQSFAVLSAAEGDGTRAARLAGAAHAAWSRLSARPMASDRRSRIRSSPPRAPPSAWQPGEPIGSTATR